MARPRMDRVEIKVWVKRSAAQWLAAQAAERGLSRSAYVRGLLTERAFTSSEGRDATPGHQLAGLWEFKARRDNALRCFTCGERYADHR